MSTNLRRPGRSSASRGDLASVYTRVLALVLLPFLVVAVVLLYVFPSDTGTLFAWTIAPPLTAMFLASAYVGGVWFFAAAARWRRWRAIKRGMPAVLVFASLLLIATLLHLDRFHAGHISFITWFVLYLTTPFLVVMAMVLQRRARDGSAAGAVADAGTDDREYRIPVPARVGLAVLGLGALATGIALFLRADALINAWPWTLTPLTAQVVGAVLTLPGVVNLGLLGDPRWSAFRIVFQAQIVSLVAIIGAVTIRSGDLERAASSVVFVGGIAASFIAYTLFYVYCERKSAQIRRVRDANRREPLRS